jgi:hypothetical protein
LALEAAIRGMPRVRDYWTVGYAWIAEQRTTLRRYLA